MSREKRKFQFAFRKERHRHAGFYAIDSYAYASRLSDRSPIFKTIFSAAVLAAGLLLDSMAVSVLIIITMAWLSICKGGITCRQYAALFKVPLFFLIVGSLAIAVDLSRVPSGEYVLPLGICYLKTSKEQLLFAAHVIVKALGAVSAMYFLTLSTPIHEIITVLSRCHLPKILVELMSLIYRFIFILMDVQCRMKQAAQARLGYADIKTSFITFGHTAGNLLIVSMKKANAYYDAMLARCYDGELVFLTEEKPVRVREVWAAAIYLCILLITALLI